jgi:hypothetical protein
LGGFGEGVAGIGLAGGEDIGGGVALNKVLLAVVKCADRDVIGDAIGNDNQMLNIVGAKFGFDRLNQAVVEFFADGFEFSFVAVTIGEEAAEF